MNRDRPPLMDHLEAVQQSGSCGQMPPEIADEYFFDALERNEKAKVKLAKRICENCFVRQDCEEMSLTIMPSYGIFAGRSPKERREELERLGQGIGGMRFLTEEDFLRRTKDERRDATIIQMPERGND